jgi:hypothetical protein
MFSLSDGASPRISSHLYQRETARLLWKSDLLILIQTIFRLEKVITSIEMIFQRLGLKLEGNS